MAQQENINFQLSLLMDTVLAYDSFVLIFWRFWVLG
jgi:hypothetical protein